MAEPDERQDEQQREPHDEQRRRRPGVVTVARKAVEEITGLLGRRPEAVVSVERRDDDGWTVGVEVVETHRIPDTSDILAIYEVRLDTGGRLRSYRRTRRYARGQLDRECRR